MKTSREPFYPSTKHGHFGCRRTAGKSPLALAMLSWTELVRVLDLVELELAMNLFNKIHSTRSDLSPNLFPLCLGFRLIRICIFRPNSGDVALRSGPSVYGAIYAHFVHLHMLELADAIRLRFPSHLPVHAFILNAPNSNAPNSLPRADTLWETRGRLWQATWICFLLKYLPCLNHKYSLIVLSNWRNGVTKGQDVNCWLLWRKPRKQSFWNVQRRCILSHLRYRMEVVRFYYRVVESGITLHMHANGGLSLVRLSWLSKLSQAYASDATRPATAEQRPSYYPALHIVVCQA